MRRHSGKSRRRQYETLLLDVMIGEATLFTRSDEVEAAWRVVDPLIRVLGITQAEAHAHLRRPVVGDPREADELIEEDGVGVAGAIRQR